MWNWRVTMIISIQRLIIISNGTFPKKLKCMYANGYIMNIGDERHYWILLNVKECLNLLERRKSKIILNSLFSRSHNALHLGGKLSEETKMAQREEDLHLTTNLNLFKDVSKLGKLKLKGICKNLGVVIEKSFGKKALVNVVCNSLGISASSTASRTHSKIESCWRETGYLLFKDTFDYGAPEAKILKEELAIYPTANG